MLNAKDIAKAALRLDWLNVESQARRVAEYAEDLLAANKSPAPIDSAKVEDTGEPVAWAATSEDGKVEALGFNQSRRFDAPLYFAAPRLPNTTPSTQAVGEPVGWKLVPLVPTDDMVQEGADNNPTCWNETTDNGFPNEVAEYVYAAMINAAPTAPTTGSAPECTCAVRLMPGQIGATHSQDCPITAWGRAAFKASGENASARPAASDDLRDSVLSALDDLKLVIDGTMGAVGLETTFVSLVEALEADRAVDSDWRCRRNNAFERFALLAASMGGDKS